MALVRLLVNSNVSLTECAAQIIPEALSSTKRDKLVSTCGDVLYFEMLLLCTTIFFLFSTHVYSVARPVCVRACVRVCVCVMPSILFLHLVLTHLPRCGEPISGIILKSTQSFGDFRGYRPLGGSIAN